MNSNNTIY